VLIHVNEEEPVEWRRNFQSPDRATVYLAAACLGDVGASTAKSIDIKLL
jgi:hypothetical protein